MNRVVYNGYLTFSARDLQWQSLHMSAAAACRGSTPHGGHGSWHNSVFPRTKGHTCTQVCSSTKFFTICDASMSLTGYMGRTTSSGQPSGLYYNYGCGALGTPVIEHEEVAKDNYLTQKYPYYLGYCCCRKPWKCKCVHLQQSDQKASKFKSTVISKTNDPGNLHLKMNDIISYLGGKSQVDAF